jgi:hypothetical protein
MFPKALRTLAKVYRCLGPLFWRECALNRREFAFGCCILFPIYPTGSLWCRQSQQSFNTLTSLLFSFSLTTREIYN